MHPILLTEVLRKLSPITVSRIRDGQHHIATNLLNLHSHPFFFALSAVPPTTPYFVFRVVMTQI